MHSFIVLAVFAWLMDTELRWWRECLAGQAANTAVPGLRHYRPGLYCQFVNTANQNTRLKSHCVHSCVLTNHSQSWQKPQVGNSFIGTLRTEEILIRLVKLSMFLTSGRPSIFGRGLPIIR